MDELTLFNQYLARGINARLPLLGQDPGNCWRVFNGFYEGMPGLVIDWFAGRILISWHPAKAAPGLDPVRISHAQTCLVDLIPQASSIWLKERSRTGSAGPRMRRLWGDGEPMEITEGGLRYGIDIAINQDASFYPDTRLLREWLRANAAGKRVLNLFAYTGSLGIAALGGGASRVLQTDLKQRFLAIGERSARLNGFEERLGSLQGDFYRVAANLKSENQLFDLVILDAPIFSQTKAGQVDLGANFMRLVNKARPLVAHGGRMVLVNNALYLSGAELMQEYEALTAAGYMQLEEQIPVPEDCTGYAQTIVDTPPSNPAPFNHPTKISIFRLTRKDQRTE